jgi:hypothetical protein
VSVFDPAEPHGGSIVDDAKRAWILAHRGPEHIKTCTVCGQDYYSPRLVADTCWGCWYASAIRSAADEFRPLSDEIERLLGVKTTVDQTGGMVMCLRVPVGDSGAWAWFSTLGELSDCEGVGLYRDEDDDGEMVFFEELLVPGPGDWCDHPDFARAVAAAAPPHIAAFAAALDMEVSP